jgi:hypothetical protein
MLINDAISTIVIQAFLNNAHARYLYWRNQMSEKAANYFVGGEINSIEKMKSLPCVLPCSHPDYKPPTPAEVGLLIKLAGWSQREVALIVGVNQTEKGSPTVRRWKTASTDKEFRQIPNATWQYLLHYAGLITIEETKNALEKYHSFVLK